MSTYSSRSDFDIDLGKYLLVFKRRWLPATFVLSAVTALATVAAITREPSFYASGKVLIKLDRTTALAGLDTPGQKSIGEPDAVGLSSDPIATEVETIRSLEVAEKTIEVLGLEDDEGLPLHAEDFLEVLDVRPLPGTDMIRVGYENADAELAATIVNQTIDTYQNNNITTKQDEAIAARQFIVDQLPNTEAAVKNAENALQRFKEQNQVVALGEESLGTIRSMQLLDNEIAQTQAQLATAIARSQELEAQLGMTPEVALQAATLSQSAAVQETFAQVRDIQNQLDIAQSSYRDTHPTVIGLQRQEAELQQRLSDRIGATLGVPLSSVQGIEMGVLEQDLASLLVQAEVERAGLSRRIDELQKLQADQQRRADLLPQLENTQRQLERQLTVAQSTHESLLQRLQDIQVAQNKTIDNIRVVSRALVPQDPTFSKKLIVAAGMLVGSMLAVITAFALDLLDRSVKTIADTQELLGLPILGVIPTSDKRGSVLLPPSNKRTGQMPHPYVLLQANLSFITAQTHDKVLLVTSSVAEEGRSRVAANLAIAMAQAGNQVLLIDADLHKPIQHQIWARSNDLGLRQILNDGIKPFTAIRTVAPNLSLLPAGYEVEGTLDMFNPQVIHQLLQQMAHRFDVILLDTSPVTQMPDASTLVALADATLMVVRPKHAKTIDLKAAKVLLELSGKPTLGIVANGVEKGTNPMQYLASSSEQAAFQTQNRPPVAPPAPAPVIPSRLPPESIAQSAYDPAPIEQTIPESA